MLKVAESDCKMTRIQRIGAIYVSFLRTKLEDLMARYSADRIFIRYFLKNLHREAGGPFYKRLF